MQEKNEESGMNDWYRYIHKSFVFPLWSLWNGDNYKHEYKKIKSFCALPLISMENLQRSALRSVTCHAFENVYYYQSLFNKLGINPYDINTYEDFCQIPILTKKELRLNIELFIDANVDRDQLIKSGTGGTTDSPIPIYYDKARNKIKTAEMAYFREWFSWYPESKVAYLWGAPMDMPNMNSWKYCIRNKLLDRTLYLFASMLNDEVMGCYIKQLNHFKPDIIQAYSNPMYILAKFILQRGISIVKPKAIIVTAELCSPAQQKIIEEAFNCSVLSFYGAREAGYIAVQCAKEKNFHINTHGVFLEILRNNRPVKPGEIGDVVLTDLHNYTMPLIRYKIGDVASLDEKKCSCDCELPLLNFIAGRETDVFVTTDGDMIPGVSLCDRVVTDCSGFSQLQFIQSKPEEILVKIVKGDKYTKQDMGNLDNILDEYFHGKVKIIKNYVDDIPKDKSGKTRFCISHVPLP